MHASGTVFKVQAIINIETIYNLIAQNLVKKYNIFKNDKVLSLMAVNRSRLRLYKQYQVAIKTHEYEGLWISDAITIYEFNMTGCKLILSMP